jgi:hypothetical protein
LFKVVDGTDFFERWIDCGSRKGDEVGVEVRRRLERTEKESFI